LENYLLATVSLLVDGISFGMILFLISCGLTVTLGVMRLLNIAHCGFAMIGGYLALALVNRLGINVLAALPLAVAGTIVIGLLLERTVYRWVYETTALGQILMTIGLTFLMIATINLAFGSLLYTLPVPSFLAGTWIVGGVAISVWRIFLALVSALLAGMLWYVLDYTYFGARLRAAVDNPRMARCVGINVRKIFAQTFAAGCGLAAVGGILGTQMLPLEPYYALKYLVLVLIVVAVGGFGSLKGSLVAALSFGVIDTFGRYLVPAAGAFVIYFALVIVLLARPQGLFARG
jgi:branched-chain amino acid transport system permease protein